MTTHPLPGFCAALAVAVTFLLSLPAAAAPRQYGPGYPEWTITKPFSGWYYDGRSRVYCDDIKYPKRSCSDRRVCRNGDCWSEPACKVTGWEIRQSCY